MSGNSFWTTRGHGRGEWVKIRVIVRKTQPIHTFWGIEHPNDEAGEGRTMEKAKKKGGKQSSATNSLWIRGGSKSAVESDQGGKKKTKSN